MSPTLDITMTFFGVALMLFVYALPSTIAFVKQHKHFTWIFAFNLTLGFLVFPWIITLMWALITPNRALRE